MELVKWFLMIGGILLCLIIGCLMLLKSAEKRQYATKKCREQRIKLEQLNESLEQSLTMLETYNEPLKQVTKQIDKFNREFL